MYKVDFDTQIKRILPPGKRKVRMLAWLSALTMPLRSLYAVFLSYRDETLLTLSYNGQTLVLERLLNLHFYHSWSPVAGNPIYIRNISSEVPSQFIYLHTEIAPLALYRDAEDKTTDLYTTTDYQAATDFTINAPIANQSDEKQLKALSEKYAIAGSRFSLKFY